jgi:hypothetical protein
MKSLRSLYDNQNHVTYYIPPERVVRWEDRSGVYGSYCSVQCQHLEHRHYRHHKYCNLFQVHIERQLMPVPCSECNETLNEYRAYQELLKP